MTEINGMKLLRVRNLTPHDITLYDDYRNIINTFISEKNIPSPRCINKTRTIKNLKLYGKEIPVLKMTMYNTVNLPKEEKDVMLLVSTIIAQHNPKRKDLFTPIRVVRNERGMIIGCRAFCSNYSGFDEEGLNIDKKINVLFKNLRKDGYYCFKFSKITNPDTAFEKVEEKRKGKPFVFSIKFDGVSKLFYGPRENHEIYMRNIMLTFKKSGIINGSSIKIIPYGLRKKGGIKNDK